MTKNKVLLLVTIIITAAAGCSLNPTSGNAAANNSPNPNTASAANDAKTNVPAANAQPTPAAKSASADRCGEPKMAGKVLIKKQMFPVDFKPFEGSCFVTFASKEEMLDDKDVPRGSTFYIFKDGKQVFAFPDAFGGQPACWIEGVSFTDLNGDGLTDVALAGSCLAAKNSYPSNAVYVNSGTAFTTNGDANTKLENLKTLKEIEAFATKNAKRFF